MRKLLLLMVLGLMGWASPAVVADDHAEDGVFIHVSHGADDPHRLLMALTMAGVMAEDHDVLMYFDIEAVHALLKDAPDVSFKQFPSSQTRLKALLEQGVTIMACPSCLEAAGKTEADLAEGIQLADKAAFFNFTEGRILTIDY